MISINKIDDADDAVIVQCIIHYNNISINGIRLLNVNLLTLSTRCRSEGPRLF